MNWQQNFNKLKKFSKLGFFSEIVLKKTLGSAWKTRVGRVSGNKQLFFLRLIKAFVTWKDEKSRSLPVSKKP